MAASWRCWWRSPRGYRRSPVAAAARKRHRGSAAATAAARRRSTAAAHAGATAGRGPSQPPPDPPPPPRRHRQNRRTAAPDANAALSINRRSSRRGIRRRSRRARSAPPHAGLPGRRRQPSAGANCRGRRRRSRPRRRPAPTVSPGYRSLLSAWLKSHKRYPESARARGEEGPRGAAVSRRPLRTRAGLRVGGGHRVPDLDAAIDAMMRGATTAALPGRHDRLDVEVQWFVRFSLTR